VKWIAFAAGALCMALTAWAPELYPWNIWVGVLSSILWTWAAARTGDLPLVLSSAVALFIYVTGAIKWLAS
jgi:hypothetical protein